MTGPPYLEDPDTTRAAPRLDAGRLWMGGIATAVVAALVVVVGVLICRGLLDIPLLAPTREGAFGGTSTARLAGLAAVAALLATGLMHLLLLTTPRPGRFFTWIMALATLIAAILPLLADAEASSRIATALINLSLGVTIGSLVSSIARSAVGVRRR